MMACILVQLWNLFATTVPALDHDDSVVEDRVVDRLDHYCSEGDHRSDTVGVRDVHLHSVGSRVTWVSRR